MEAAIQILCGDFLNAVLIRRYMAPLNWFGRIRHKKVAVMFLEHKPNALRATSQMPIVLLFGGSRTGGLLVVDQRGARSVSI